MVFENNGDLIRASLVAYAADCILQDILVEATALQEDLFVGDCVDINGAVATDAADIAFVVCEPAKAGSTSFIAVNPVMTIISKMGLITDLDIDNDVVPTLQKLGFTFSDYDRVALRTT
ncbi:hypothetical protein SR70_06640 [Klebsiella aerogenes]|uniref:hypothetical protein n=1 Tax=Klebsiella aerogenes TaxID=548 RepID=UPI0005EE530C|nr:hypothetical protein [Klebsiella aerogenes]KJP43145.1 hypothetical protein SR70_06640 [Klebsiella aerogenes]